MAYLFADEQQRVTETNLNIEFCSIRLSYWRIHGFLLLPGIVKKDVDLQTYQWLKEAFLLLAVLKVFAVNVFGRKKKKFQFN